VRFNGVSLGSYGVSLTPAPGWTITKQDPDSVVLVSGDQTAGIYIAVGGARLTDITQELSANIQKYIAGEAVQVGPMGTPWVFPGQNFNLRVFASYQGTWSSQQGTTPIFGVFNELLNTSTGQSAFIDYFSASSATLTAKAAEANSMINSLG
jgi:hypothetical protein